MNELICQNADTLTAIGTGLWLATALLRPFIPPEAIEALGTAGKVVEVLTGNTKHCKNAKSAKPVDQQDRVTKRPK